MACEYGGRDTVYIEQVFQVQKADRVLEMRHCTLCEAPKAIGCASDPFVRSKNSYCGFETTRIKNHSGRRGI